MYLSIAVSLYRISETAPRVIGRDTLVESGIDSLVEYCQRKELLLFTDGARLSSGMHAGDIR